MADKKSKLNKMENKAYEKKGEIKARLASMKEQVENRSENEE